MSLQNDINNVQSILSVSEKVSNRLGAILSAISLVMGVEIGKSSLVWTVTPIKCNYQRSAEERKNIFSKDQGLYLIP